MNDHHLEVAEVLKQSDVFRLSWFDVSKTIIVLEIFKAWTWDDAFDVVPLLGQMIQSQAHDVYSVYYYHIRKSSLLPRDGLANLQQLVNLSPPNEKLVFFIHQDTLTAHFVTMLGRVYRFVRKYRFVTSLDEAMSQIETDKAQSS